MSKILITGKNGGLGSEFLRFYNDQAAGVDYKELDITDEKAVRAKVAELRPQVIINCAAYNSVDRSETEPDKANQINGYAVGYLAQAARSIGAILIHYSSNYVFDGTKQTGYNENDPPGPRSAYGQSKLLGERQAMAAGKFYIIRTAWLYGQAGTGPSSKVNYVDRILQLAAEKTVLEGVNDQYGQPTWTADLAQATARLIADKAPYGIYHLTNSGIATWYTWAQEILKIKGLTNIELRENRMSNFHSSGHNAPRPQYGLLNNTKASLLRPWQEALADYLSANS